MATMTASNKKVATTILKAPEEATRLTLKEMAKVAGVSEPSVIRFCHALELKGYSDLQREMLLSINMDGRFVRRAIKLEDDPQTLIDKVINCSINGLMEVSKQLDPNTLQQVVTLLSKASRVDLYAFGGSVPVAMDAQHKLFRIEVPATVHSDPHLQRMSACSLEKNSVVMAISNSGKTEALLRSLELVKEQGIPVVAMAPAQTPVIGMATHPIEVLQDNADALLLPLSARLVYLALVDMISIGIAQLKGPAAERKLRKMVDSQTQLRISPSEWRARQKRIGS